MTRENTRAYLFERMVKSYMDGTGADRRTACMEVKKAICKHLQHKSND